MYVNYTKRNNYTFNLVLTFKFLWVVSFVC